MFFRDEFLLEGPLTYDPELLSPLELDELFKESIPSIIFVPSPDNSFIQEKNIFPLGDVLSFKINKDSMIEINNVYMRNQLILRNRIADAISFQFVLSVKRSELLGEHRIDHSLGPAVIVSAIPNTVTTYRMPKANVTIRHVEIFTTLSTLLERMDESAAAYPIWLQEILEGNHKIPRQRILFLEDVHQGLLWSCFHRPVTGSLVSRWIKAKFDELLCIGLQLLKNDQSPIVVQPRENSLPYGEKMRKAKAILDRAYARPPSLPALARQLGISETELKRDFKSTNGVTVRQYCIRRRIDAAKLLLEENRHAIAEIGDMVGYRDHSAFSRIFQRNAGCSPRKWRSTYGALHVYDIDG